MEDGRSGGWWGSLALSMPRAEQGSGTQRHDDTSSIIAQSYKVMIKRPISLGLSLASAVVARGSLGP